jgi:hypothetical protein
MAKTDPKLAAAWVEQVKAGAKAERAVTTAKEAIKARKINSKLAASIGDL